MQILIFIVTNSSSTESPFYFDANWHHKVFEVYYSRVQCLLIVGDSKTFPPTVYPRDYLIGEINELNFVAFNF